jgi:hypothetical protein
MSKVKLIILIAVIVLIGALASGLQIYFKKYQSEKAERERLWNNNLQLTAEKRTHLALIYTKDEFIRVISDSLRKSLDSLKIKPKQVIKVIYRTLTDIDTVNHTVFVDYRKTHWLVSDTGNCFIWSGMAFLSDTSLKVTRTDFKYENSLPELYWTERPHKFLFIKWGKRKVKHITSPKCGGISQETIIEIK